MLQDEPIVATIPATDINRAKSFYTDKLGLRLTEERDEGLFFDCGSGTQMLVFPSSGASSGAYTQASWDVKNVDAEITALRSRGVKFEEYDTPNFKTVNGIAEIPGGRGGWFKDSEGNLLAVFQRN